MTALKKSPGTQKSAPERHDVNVEFSGVPKEFLFFNCHLIERSGDFVTMLLAFSEQGSPAQPVFRGVIWNHDLASQVHDLEKYLEKIGRPSPDPDNAKFPSLNLPHVPIPLNQIGCASRGSWGEISIRQFSHKAALDLRNSKSESATVAGVTHGVYVSPIEAHKRLICDLIISAKP
ncbi:MAG: hypothetical protein NTW21_09935 [Verrucomicrobia bacterium]|nr:hypothetical protein [Verrucomicrobiota bacterium]